MSAKHSHYVLMTSLDASPFSPLTQMAAYLVLYLLLIVVPLVQLGKLGWCWRTGGSGKKWKGGSNAACYMIAYGNVAALPES